jgi:hypothetical protein
MSAETARRRHANRPSSRAAVRRRGAGDLARPPKGHHSCATAPEFDRTSLLYTGREYVPGPRRILAAPDTRSGGAARARSEGDRRRLDKGGSIPAPRSSRNQLIEAEAADRNRAATAVQLIVVGRVVWRARGRTRCSHPSSALIARPSSASPCRTRRHRMGQRAGMSLDAGGADGPRARVKTVTRRSRDGR